MDTCKKNLLIAKHNFDEWTTLERGKILNTITNDSIGWYLVQQRKCKNCAYIQIDKQTQRI